MATIRLSVSTPSMSGIGTSSRTRSGLSALDHGDGLGASRDAVVTS